MTTNAGKKKRKQEHFPEIVYVFGDFGNNIGRKETNAGKNTQTQTKRASSQSLETLLADEARFELAEGVTLTRFRGVLLRPLGHSSILRKLQNAERNATFQL